MSFVILSEEGIMVVPYAEADKYSSGMVHSDLVITKEQIQSLLDGNVLCLAVDECSIFVRLTEG